MKGRLRVRQHTLPPTFQPETEDKEPSLISEAERILDRVRLDRTTEVLTANSSRPGPHVHGVEPRMGSRFWALDDNDSDSDEESNESIDTPTIYQRAQEAGFTIPQVHLAEKELNTSSI